MIYLVAILFYLLFLTGVGLYKSRQVKTGADFSVAGRTLSPWVVVLTMLAVWIGTGSIVGEAEQAYERGMAALILPLGTFIGLLILTQIAGKARGFEVYSVPEIIGSRYGRVARMLAVISLIIAYMVILSYQFNAGGAVLEVITGDRTAVALKAGDIVSRHQIVKGFVQFTPEGDWSGTVALALAAKSGEGWSGKPVELVVNVVSKESVIKAREELKAKGTSNAIVIKENNFAKYNMADLSDDFDKENEFRIVSVPQSGKLELIEPILTARTATIIAAVFIITYTVLAGLMSLAYCDVFNGSIILIGMLIAFPFLLVKAGGFAGMERAFAVMGDRPYQMQFWGVYSWPQLFNYLMPPFLLIMGDANLYQRFFACRSAKGARQAAYTMVFLAILVELLIIASAWAAASLTPDPANGKYILIYSARHYMPIALGLLFMVTVVAIIVSTAESFLLIPATTFIRDVYMTYINPKAGERRVVFFSRLLVLVFGVVGYVVTLMFSERTGFFKKAMYAYTIYGAAITPCLVAALFWRRATWQGAIISIVSGTVMSLGWSEAFFVRFLVSPETCKKIAGQIPEWVRQLDAVLPAITASVIALIVVSLLTAKKEK